MFEVLGGFRLPPFPEDVVLAKLRQFSVYVSEFHGVEVFFLALFD
jgi:hypothetical protein